MDFNYKYYQENSDQSNELFEYTMYPGKYDIKLINNNKIVESFQTSTFDDFLYQGILEAYNKISSIPSNINSSNESRKYSIAIFQAYTVIKNNSPNRSSLEEKPASPPFKTESLQPIAFQLNDTMNNGVKPIVTNTYSAFKDKKMGMESASYGTGLIIAYQNNLTTYSRNFSKPEEISKYYSKELIPEYVFEISYGLTNVYNIYKIILNNNMTKDYDFIYNYLLETQKRGINQILSYPMSASYVIGIFIAYMYKDLEELDIDSIKQIQNLYLESFASSISLQQVQRLRIRDKPYWDPMNNDLIKDMSLNIALSMHKLIHNFQQNQTFALLCTGIPDWN